LWLGFANSISQTAFPRAGFQNALHAVEGHQPAFIVLHPTGHAPIFLELAKRRATSLRLVGLFDDSDHFGSRLTNAINIHSVLLKPYLHGTTQNTPGVWPFL